MNGAVQAWLPVDVVVRTPVRAALNQAIDEWSKAWFDQTDLVVANYNPVHGAARSAESGSPWRFHGEKIAISSSKRTSTRLLELALRTRINPPLLTETDRAVLDGIEQDILGGLVIELEKRLGGVPSPILNSRHAQDPFNDSSGLTIELAEKAGGHLLSIAIPLSELISLCAASLNQPRRSSAKLTPIVRALGPTRVTLEATLGDADLSLSDLDGLAPGDVLVLDATVSSGARLRLSQSGATIAQGRLLEVEGHMALALNG